MYLHYFIVEEGDTFKTVFFVAFNGNSMHTGGFHRSVITLKRVTTCSQDPLPFFHWLSWLSLMYQTKSLDTYQDCCKTRDKGFTCKPHKKPSPRCWLIVHRGLNVNETLQQGDADHTKREQQAWCWQGITESQARDALWCTCFSSLKWTSGHWAVCALYPNSGFSDNTVWVLALAFVNKTGS